MRLYLKDRTISTAVVIPSAVIVIALAVLQYRWSARISEATAVRLADSLQMSLMNWQKDFFRYFSEIGLALRIDPVEDAPGDLSQYARRFAEWKASAKYPGLISDVHLLTIASNAPSGASRLDWSARHFESEAWPRDFEPVRWDLQTASTKMLPPKGLPGAMFNVDDHSMGWLFDPEIPALFHPVLLASSPPGSTSRKAVGWIAVRLDERQIRGVLMPALSRTYFQGTDGLDYLVAVVSESAPDHVLYSSDRGFGDPEPADADGTIDLFARVGDKAVGSPVHVFHMPSDNKGPDALADISWFPLLRKTSEQSDWRLVVRHRRGGPLGAFVVETRRRDLATGFGVLLILVINMAMLIVTSHRAQRLAQLQMDFVTAVSHELRTPLTVIISGAENIATGVVDTKQQMVQYGSVIANQARQLFGLVERILLFAATRQGPLRYDLRPLQVHEMIDAALASTAGLIESSHFTVECEIDDDLPEVLGDATGVSQCLQNLITNALKYGRESSWIGIRARAATVGPGRQEVQISVSDRGAGIAPEDLPHIFEPFYRSHSARAAQIHGTGLGLPLSKSIAEAMDGRLTVGTAIGHGTTFTLHLPCADKPLSPKGSPTRALTE